MCRLINRCIDITTPPASQITARVSCGVRGPCPAHERLRLPIHSVRVDAAMVCVREAQPRTTSSPSASGAPSWAPPPPQHPWRLSSLPCRLLRLPSTPSKGLDPPFRSENEPQISRLLSKNNQWLSSSSLIFSGIIDCAGAESIGSPAAGASALRENSAS